MQPCDLLVLSAAQPLDIPANSVRPEREERARPLYLQEIPLRHDVAEMQWWMDLNA